MQADHLSLVEQERLALRAMCTGTPQGSVLETARRLLRSYSWREPVHQAIFQAVESIPSDSPEDIRNRLLTRLTVRGFPDVDCADLFQPHCLSKEEAERLFWSLAGGGGRNLSPGRPGEAGH